MAYTTASAVRVASGFSDTTNITTATIEAYIADADRVIDSYIGDVYTLPLSATSELIETLSRHITVGLLYANEYGEESQGTDKGWKARLDWAMEQLVKIQEKKMKLYDSSGDELDASELYSPAFLPDATTSAVGGTDEARVIMSQQF